MTAAARNRGGRPCRELLALSVVAAATLVIAYLAPHSHIVHADQLAYGRAIQRIRHGQGFYPAYRDAYLDGGIRMGRARGFRQPWLFELWALVPPSLLWPTFLIVVVGGTTALIARLADEPLVAVVPGVFLALAGRTFIVEWLLFELWAVPFLAGALLAWRHKRWWPAAVLAGAAVLIRETSIVFLGAGFLLSLARRTPRRPWLVCGAVAAAAFAVHLHIAGHSVLAHGNDRALTGGTPPGTIVDMMVWPFVEEPRGRPFLLLAWLLAIVAVVRRRLPEPVVALLAIPLVGLFVSRPYWGLLATPFALWLGADELLRIWRPVLAARKQQRDSTADHPPEASSLAKQ